MADMSGAWGPSNVPEVGTSEIFSISASNKKRNQPYLIIAAPLPSADPTLLISVPEYFV